MSSTAHNHPATGDDVFDSLIVLAKARVLVLVETRRLARSDGAFILRALFDLEADGVEILGSARPADAAFYHDLAAYLHARVGGLAVDTLALAPSSVSVLAGRAERERLRAAELLGLADMPAFESSVGHASRQLVNPLEVTT